MLASTIGIVAVLVPLALNGCGSSGGTNANGDGGSGSGSGSGGSSGGLFGHDGGSSGSSGGSSSGSGSSSGTEGVSATCIAGTQGCLCDSTGTCAPGLTCTPQSAPKPPLCCSGGNCSYTGGVIGAHCGTGQNGATCTAGITIPTAAGANDNCGYATSTFNESIVLCGITATGGGSAPATVSAFYADEHALTLGCTTAQYPVSPLSASPSQVHYPQLGDPACTDSFNRPLRPVLYVTDVSGDPTCTAGDLQGNGTAYDPVAIYGTWKDATETAGSTQGTPVQADPQQNNWNNGGAPAASPVPAAIQACTFNNNNAGVSPSSAYTAQVDFEVGLISGHSYRLQVIVHDGDQRRGGDSGEGCVTFCAGTGKAVCPPGVPACGAGGTCPTGTTCDADGCCRAGGGDGGIIQ
jgi:hypothetical protein